MDLVQIAAVVGGILAVVGAAIWLGHHLGSTAALAKVKTDAQALGSAVGADLRQFLTKEAQKPAGTVLHEVGQFIEHPIATTQAALAQHHLATIQSAARALWDDTASLAKIAEGQAEIEARAALRAQAAAVVSKLASPSAA